MNRREPVLPRVQRGTFDELSPLSMVNATCAVCGRLLYLRHPNLWDRAWELRCLADMTHVGIGAPPKEATRGVQRFAS